MDIFGILGAILGPALGRVILRSWLDDGDIAEELTASITQIVRSKGSDTMAQIRAERQFRVIGERIALSMFPILEADSTYLDDSEKAAIISAVTDTLNNSVINAKVLAELSLEPNELAKYLVQNSPNVTRGFSEVEANLYHRIISECSTYIVDTSSNLPAFSVYTFAQILENENELLDVAIKILNEVQQIRLASSTWNMNNNFIQFETEYLRTVVRKLDEMELFGADVSRASRKHPLNVAYVTLSVEREFMDHAESRLVISVDDLLAESRYLLIRGLAGSGKTTLLKWIAVQSASSRFTGELRDWNKLVPFFVRLRHFANMPLPNPQNFPAHISPFISDMVPTNWVVSVLRSGRGIVLIDGIDEIPFTQRTDVQEWITDLVQHFPLSRFIVTSRPSAVEEGWLADQKFEDALLQPMEHTQIMLFVDQWHKAVNTVIYDHDEKEQLVTLSKNLKKKLTNKKGALTNLAPSPLLCAMICALHRDRKSILSNDRAELYEACTNMLLERRDAERGIDLYAYPQLSYRQKKSLLQSFAYWMLQNGWSEVEIGDADEHFDRLLDLMGKFEEVSGKQMRKFFIERSGMLRLVSSSRIAFTHRTFQEYLGAQEALDQDDIGFLIQKAYDYQWHEVIMLSASLAKAKQANKLVKGILSKGTGFFSFTGSDTSLRRNMIILAATCTNAAVSLDHTVVEDVTKQLSGLLPPKDFKEAEQFVDTAPLIIPLLHRGSKNLSEKEKTTCIYLLTMIGGAKALEIIEEYSSTDISSQVLIQLLLAWTYFDEASYAERVLSKTNLAQLQELRLPYGKLFNEIIKYFSMDKLYKLSIDRCHDDHDLNAIGSFKQLQFLAIRCHSQITNLAPLGNLTNLRRLVIYDFRGVQNIDSLITLHNLTDLRLVRGSGSLDLKPLAHLPSLKYLEIKDISNKNIEHVLRTSPTLETIKVGDIERHLKHTSA